MSEEFEEDRHPGNPRLCETVEQFLRRQKKAIGQTTWPPGTKFECKGCGDCCKWNFIVMDNDENLANELRARVNYPHGSWTLIEELRIRIEMPPGFSVIGRIPDTTSEFLMRTGRRWGYWVLNERGKVILYNPTPCIHLRDDGLCNIYDDRPAVCETYFCKRYPIP